MRHRPRRLRKNSTILALVQENIITTNDLIYPLFVSEELQYNEKSDILSMPDIKRFSLKALLAEIKECVELNIMTFMLFPIIAKYKKTPDAKESFNDNGIIQIAIREIKSKYPQVLIISDIALDPFTTHGHDGVVNNNGYVLNDATIEILQKQALSHAKAGADIVAPSDMMDGRIGAIRDILEHNNYCNTVILSYAVKYSSNYYGPFREAVGSVANFNGVDKSSYQMNSANSDEALKEVALDLTEGADIVMIKPAMPYLDIIYRIKQKFKNPTFAYQVSAEYSMLKIAAQNNIIDEKKVVLESIMSFKRAGADAIATYYAKDIAKWLKN